MSGPPLALSLGDPAGIGPEIALGAWRELRGAGPVFFVVGDRRVLAAAAPDAPLRTIGAPDEAAGVFDAAVPVLDRPGVGPLTFGHPDPAWGPAILDWIETGVRLSLSGQASGLVTAPIAKASLYAAGFRFPGHTEFLGELTAEAPYPLTRGPVMMLMAADLRVTLVTVHLPLADVSGRLTRDAIVHAGRVTAEALQRDFGVPAPRLAVAGLNPHAGEAGQLGREEVEIIAPAVAELAAAGVAAEGPFPADSLFAPEIRSRYDAVLCMYHDQALIPVKMLDFWGGVNVTLGLPVVRASPDHGTAFDIAGKGVARPDSLVAALRAADAIARRRAA